MRLPGKIGDARKSMIRLGIVICQKPDPAENSHKPMILGYYKTQKKDCRQFANLDGFKRTIIVQS